MIVPEQPIRANRRGLVACLMLCSAVWLSPGTSGATTWQLVHQRSASALPRAGSGSGFWDSAPTGAKAGWNAPATMGAEAAPPMFAWEPTAMKKTGDFSSNRSSSKLIAWIVIHMPQIKNNIGVSKTRANSAFAPMLATKR